MIDLALEAEGAFLSRGRAGVGRRSASPREPPRAPRAPIPVARPRKRGSRERRLRDRCSRTAPATSLLDNATSYPFELLRGLDYMVEAHRGWYADAVFERLSRTIFVATFPEVTANIVVLPTNKGAEGAYRSKVARRVRLAELGRPAAIWAFVPNRGMLRRGRVKAFSLAQVVALAASLAGCADMPTPLAPSIHGSVGVPHHGVITNAVALPQKGPGFERLRKDAIKWGNPRLVAAIEAAAADVIRERLRRRSARHRRHRRAMGRAVERTSLASHRTTTPTCSSS